MVQAMVFSYVHYGNVLLTDVASEIKTIFISCSPKVERPHELRLIRGELLFLQ